MDVYPYTCSISAAGFEEKVEMQGAYPTAKYSAFLSYSHADRTWGEWLQRSLESYRIPADLVGRTTPSGRVPNTLRPVFRDRWDLSAGHSLTEEINAALEASRYLVVLCSPSSARSKYVNEEIFRFKQLGRERQILPIIVGGRPGDAEDECFPDALRFNRSADGSLQKNPNEPLAADARPEGDDKELAKLKIIAGILGVPLDEVRKRDAIEQRKKVRRARLLAGSMSALAMIAVAGAGIAWWQYGIAEAQRWEAERRYEQALDSTLRFVTTSATFRALLDAKKQRISSFTAALYGEADPSQLKALLNEAERGAADFADLQIEGKGANSDFQEFVGERDSERIWMRLVDVLLRYERELPWELRHYGDDLDKAKMPLHWVKHAETIVRNLVRMRGPTPEYTSKLVEVRSEIVRHKGEPAKDCAVRPTMPSEKVAQEAPETTQHLNQMAQAPLVQGALGEPCQ